VKGLYVVGTKIGMSMRECKAAIDIIREFGGEWRGLCCLGMVYEVPVFVADCLELTPWN
jgi:hypothetical protein